MFVQDPGLRRIQASTADLVGLWFRPVASSGLGALVCRFHAERRNGPGVQGVRVPTSPRASICFAILKEWSVLLCSPNMVAMLPEPPPSRSPLSIRDRWRAS